MREDEIRTLPYRLKLGDFFAFYLKTYYSGFVRFPRALFFLAFIFGVPLIGNLQGLRQGQYAGFVASSCLFVLLWLMVIPGLGLVSSWMNFRQNKGNAVPRVAVLNNEGVRFEGEGTGSALAWTMFSKAVESRTNVFLYTTPNCAYIIPKSAFDTPAACTAFVAAATTHSAQANHKQIGAFYEAHKPTEPGAGDAPPFRLTFRIFLPLYLDIYYASLRQPTTLILTGVMFVGLSAWGASKSRSPDAMVSAFLGMLATLLVISLILAPPVLAFLAWLRARGMAGAKGDRYVRMTEDGIGARGDAYEVNVKWRDLYRIKKSFGVILFKTAPQNGVVLPMSAFSDPAAAAAFYERARTYWKAAKAAK